MFDLPNAKRYVLRTRLFQHSHRIMLNLPKSPK